MQDVIVEEKLIYKRNDSWKDSFKNLFFFPVYKNIIMIYIFIK